MRLAVWVWMISLLVPFTLNSQQTAGGAAPKSPRAPESWHAALEARAALRDSTPSQENVLRALSAELLLGRPGGQPQRSEATHRDSASTS